MSENLTTSYRACSFGRTAVLSLDERNLQVSCKSKCFVRAVVGCLPSRSIITGTTRTTSEPSSSPGTAYLVCDVEKIVGPFLGAGTNRVDKSYTFLSALFCFLDTRSLPAGVAFHYLYKLLRFME